MRSANDVPLDVLWPATKAVVNRLLHGVLDGTYGVGSRTDHSDTITGYKGVSAHLYTSPGENGTLQLQVQGPEPLIREVVRHYGGTYKLWGRLRGKVLFELSR